jgi:hypothetical protein
MYSGSDYFVGASRSTERILDFIFSISNEKSNNFQKIRQ